MAYTRDEIFNKLSDFVAQQFIVEKDEINMDESLIDQGVIDSLGLIEITTFIEKQFGVTVVEEDMTRENFGSMNKMVDHIFRAVNK
ncbi:MAG: acyl carrier protein [Spirochaetes bacterium]|nr:acyl carrier protein [Spirochaetota bacterium]